MSRYTAQSIHSSIAEDGRSDLASPLNQGLLNQTPCISQHPCSSLRRTLARRRRRKDSHNLVTSTQAIQNRICKSCCTFTLVDSFPKGFWYACAHSFPTIACSMERYKQTVQHLYPMGRRPRSREGQMNKGRKGGRENQSVTSCLIRANNLIDFGAY